MGEIQTNFYTVERGDTLSKISKDKGIDIKELARINNIQDINKIHTGQRIKLSELKDEVNKEIKVGDIKGKGDGNDFISTGNDLFYGQDGKRKEAYIGTFNKDTNGKWNQGSYEIPYYLLGEDFLRLYGGEDDVKAGKKKVEKLMDSFNLEMDRIGEMANKSPKYQKILKKNNEYLKENSIVIKWLQEQLFNEVGSDKFEVSGELDFKTIVAIGVFQKKHGMEQTGIVDNALFMKLVKKQDARLLSNYNYNDALQFYGVNKNPSVKIKSFDDFKTPGYRYVIEALKNFPDISTLSKNENGRYYTQRNGDIEDGNIRYGEPYIDTIVGIDGNISYGWFQKGTEVIYKNGAQGYYGVDAGKRRIG